MYYAVNIPLDPTIVDPAAVREYAQAVEAMGFEAVLTPDHILTPDMTKRSGTYTREMSVFRESFVTLAYIAACTTRIKLGMAVLVLTQRQTALVAKQAAEVDVLSGGRLRMGIGVGWSEDEFENLGQDFHTRGRRAEEQLAVLKALWTQEAVSFHGEWHHISEAGINPLPVQRPIPIWIGGNSDPVLRRIARHGDGWLPEGRPEAELKELLDRLRGYTAEAGRDPAAIAVEGRTSLRSQDPDQWAEALATWQRVGADGVSVTTHNAGCKTIDDHIALLRRFRETARA